MDVWAVIEAIKEAEELRSDSALARSIKLEPASRGLAAGYFWNVRNGIRGLSQKVIENLAGRAEKHKILKSKLEVLQFKDDCRRLEVQRQPVETGV